MASEDERPELTIGELFLDGDLVAQWVFSLTAVAEDVMVLTRSLRDATERGDVQATMSFYASS